MLFDNHARLAPKSDSQDVWEADLARKLFAFASAAILIGIVVIAWLRPFGDGQRGEYIFVGAGALFALAKTSFESLRWHIKWRRLLREPSP